jgi:UDP-2-acetamido-3-amino-2,3-dideoxy-glucuronate N-acetyltransferase
VSRRDKFAPTRIGRGASIGANATVVCGVTIGAYTMIGAGAVIARDVPAHALMIGGPAHRIGWACRCGETLPRELACERCGDRYIEQAGALTLDTSA